EPTRALRQHQKEKQKNRATLRQRQKVKLPLHHCTARCTNTSCALCQRQKAKPPPQLELCVAPLQAARCARHRT
ncbi:hypothetical protein A2U01_0092931, partial [Trifolium medium]|nr:hypothetical protein [Trifolium medium]